MKLLVIILFQVIFFKLSEICRSSSSLLSNVCLRMSCLFFVPDHHPGSFEWIISSPKLPNDPSEVAVVGWVDVVFAVQVWFEAAKSIQNSEIQNVWMSSFFIEYIKMPRNYLYEFASQYNFYTNVRILKNYIN